MYKEEWEEHRSHSWEASHLAHWATELASLSTCLGPSSALSPPPLYPPWPDLLSQKIQWTVSSCLILASPPGCSLDFFHLCSQDFVSNRPSGFIQLMRLELPIQTWDSCSQECFLLGYLLAQKTCVGRACYLVTCNAWIMITINQTSLLCAGEPDGPTG